MSLIKYKLYIHQIIQYTLLYYEHVFKENLQDVKIHISNDISQDAKLFINVSQNDDQNNENGRYIEPNPMSVNPVILINFELFKKDGYPFIATILHELTHASDYKKFNDEYCNGKWIMLRRHKSFPALYYWSEYHARIIEILHLRILASILFPDKYTYDCKNIKTEMIENQLEYYNNQLTKVFNSNKPIQYDLFTYCARIYSCKTYIGNFPINVFIPFNVYELFPNIEKLYKFLEPMQTYDIATKHFEDLTFLLDNLFE